MLVGQAQRWHNLGIKANRARKAHEIAATMLKVYPARQQTYFAKILNGISGRAAEIYGKPHPGEGLADVCIEPWDPKASNLPYLSTVRIRSLHTER